MGEFDKGLIVVEGKLVKGVKMADAEAAIDEELNKIMSDTIADEELSKVKNKVESTIVFSEIDLSGRALNLAVAEYMGDANLINTELELYTKVTAKNIQQQAKEIFAPANCSTLYYMSKN